MNAMTKLLPSENPLGSRHKQFMRDITLGDLTVAGKCTQPGPVQGEQQINKNGTETSACEINRTWDQT